MIIYDASIFQKKRYNEGLVMVSGGFDPLHPGHISYFREAAKLGSGLVVVVNGDWFLTQKKGRPFICLQDRCEIIDALIDVDFVYPFEIKDDMTVCEAIKRIKPSIFAKGGDRCDRETIPEWETCETLGIKIVTGVGDDKKWSSSNYLDDWYKFKVLQNETAGNRNSKVK